MSDDIIAAASQPRPRLASLAARISAARPAPKDEAALAADEAAALRAFNAALISGDGARVIGPAEAALAQARAALAEERARLRPIRAAARAQKAIEVSGAVLDVLARLAEPLAHAETIAEDLAQNFEGNVPIRFGELTPAAQRALSAARDAVARIGEAL